ncbi:3-deoxy-manno-octulosonate cytidylyltransferase [Thiotrichales bacterium 19S3-7]|nr:3-deoxy-manno-octulosonate cytidylyltransferase [Thiotrichales bacterium 19S3-7]MCF6802512.1 3-deoxy-manno-octulosonate cytidylyltransferase [Thiotrichales bacterium 19S3-11]
MAKKRIIIPARLDSQRLPRKALLKIHGKSIIQWVYERAMACQLDSVLVATDSEEIVDEVRSFGGDVCMTSKAHPSGTDRLAEAVRINNYALEDIIINIQGDEPLIPAKNVHQVADNLLAHPEAAIATLGEPIEHIDEVLNPNCVKVVTDKNSYALYFSRAPIPWARDHFPKELPSTVHCYRHIGMYAYRCEFLARYSQLAPSPLESWERLEQLRVIWHGEKIHFAVSSMPTPPGVDTEADLKKVISLFESSQ